MMELTPIHLPEPIAPLPINVPLADQESGMSYLFRLLFRNGLNLIMYRQLTGSDYRATPDSQHSNLIGHLGGVDPTSLRSRFLHTQTISGKKFHCLGGNQLSNYGHLRGKAPQICIPCLRNHGAASLAWEFSVLTCCPTHNCYLVDTCHHCRKALTWNRPALDICSCGHYLSEEANGTSRPSKQELALASHVHFLIDPHPTTKPTELPQWLALLSIDGLTFFVRAFGACTKANQSFPSSKSFCRTKTSYWIGLIQRALPRFIELDDCTEAIKPLIYLPLLERFSALYANPEDQEVANDWLTRLAGRLPTPQKIHKPIQGRLFT